LFLLLLNVFTPLTTFAGRLLRLIKTYSAVAFGIDPELLEAATRSWYVITGESALPAD